MFFAIDLLLPRHNGRFAIAWICATRGITYLKTTDVINCDIVKLW